MLRERVEGKWIDCFAEVFGRRLVQDPELRPAPVETAR